MKIELGPTLIDFKIDIISFVHDHQWCVIAFAFPGGFFIEIKSVPCGKKLRYVKVRVPS